MTLQAQGATEFRLASPFGTGAYRVRRGASAAAKRAAPADGVIVLKLKKGERVTLGPA